jgi:tetratricopeptide (TPR) repeat protein
MKSKDLQIKFYVGSSYIEIIAKKYLDYITVAASLQDSSDLRYHEIAAIKTWLESRYQYFSNIFSANTSLIEQLKNADEKINNHALIYNELGTLYFGINKLDSSSYYYKRAIEYCPTWMYPIGNLGYNYEKQGNDSLALYYYKMANRMAPSHSFPIKGIGQLYAKYNDYTKAKTYLNQALTIDSTDFHTLQILGSIAFEENEFQLSKDYYEKAIRLDSTQAESWSGLATADSKMMNDSAAEQEFFNAIKYAQLHYGLKSDKINLFYDNFSSHLINFKKYKLADSIISIILKQDSSNIIAWNKRAQVMFYSGKVQEAESSLLRALQINPTAGTTNYNLSCIYSIKGRLNESLSYLEYAIKFGYKEYELFESDPDLENLRKTDGYKKLIRRYK